MRRFVNGLELIKDMDRFLRDTQAGAKVGHDKMAEKTLYDWKDLTSGNLAPAVTVGSFARGLAPSVSTPTGKRRALSKYQLAARGRRGQVPLLPINIQTGALFKSMRKRTVTASANKQSFDVGPTKSAGRSIFVVSPGGTTKMVARQLWPVTEKRWKARGKAFFDYMQELSITGKGSVHYST